MKKKFSTKWVGSKQPRKQRKYRANAPIHTRHKMISANLSKELRKKYGKRNMPLRKGDEVKILRGEFKGKSGNIDAVSLKKLKVMVEGIFRTKKDGTKVSVYLDPSNLQIRELNLDDKKRMKTSSSQKQKAEQKIEKSEPKTDTKEKPTEFKKLPKETKQEDKK